MRPWLVGRWHAVDRDVDLSFSCHYPIPLHRQQAYKHFPVGKAGVAVSDKIAAEVIALPMHAYLESDVQDRIIDVVRRTLKK